LVTIQLALWPFFLILFFACLYYFYLAPNAVGLKIIHGTNAIIGIAKILILFMGVNFISIVSSIIASIALDVQDSKLYFRLKWGFLPGFAKDFSYRDVREKTTTAEAALLIAQPILARMYIVIIGIFLILSYFRVPTGSQEWMTSILLATIQASIINILIDLLPIGNNTSTRFLNVIGLMPKGFFRLSVQRMKTNIHYFFTGKFNRIGYLSSFLFLLLFLVMISLKLVLLIFIIIPSLSIETPMVLGYWTPGIVRICLGLLLLRFLIARILPFFFKTPNASLSARGAYHPQSLDSAHPDARPSILHRLFKSRRILALLLIIILFLPFPATISATTVVTESKGLDIRASEASIVTQLLVDGPSEKKISKGSLLLMLSSPELQATYDSTQQEIANLETLIRTAQIQIRSLSSGSAVLNTKDRDDELTMALADEKRYASEVDSYQKQLDLTEDTVKAYTDLVKSGAVSDQQLRTWLTTKEQLIGQLATAQGNLKSARATINKARRNKFVDQDIKLSEQLSVAKETLEGATRKKSQSVITLSSIKERLGKFKILMPFDGVVSSQTTGLLNRSVAAGETLLTVKALPLTNLVATVPDYDRNKISVGMPCTVRLYSEPHREYAGKIASISSATIDENDLKYIEVTIQIRHELPTNYIGTEGYAKIIYGKTFLLKNLLTPIYRFFNLDVWSYLP
jgi:multidrug resistance efflux pump